MRRTLALTLVLPCIAYAELPLKRIALFDSGVGYFERVGSVDAGEGVELTFTAEQMVDAIKSLLVLDTEGSSPVVTYDTRDPLDRTLRSFRVYLGDNPARSELLNRLRGVVVRVSDGEATLEGPVLGVERSTVVDDEAVIERWHLNVLEKGLVRTVALESLQSFEVLDPAVRDDLTRALELMAANLDRTKKTMRIRFGGAARRDVRLGYLLEAPVWKTSYRLNVDEKEVLLQGWAHVENTSDEDWNGIGLSLVSGKPLSFVQNLYDPLYVTRPVVENDVAAAAPPPEYEAPAYALAEGDMMPEAPLAAYAPAAAPAKAEAAARGRQFFAAAPVPQVATREAGELFEYAIDYPVSLPRQQSAMVPIVNRSVKGRSLSIYNESVNSSHPLNGVELENTSGLSLKGGPVTVIEGGIYAGDARMSDLMSGEKRLLSYSIDLSRDVVVERDYRPEEVVSVKILKGTITTSRKYAQDVTYVIRNKADEPRPLLVEHPRRPGWELDGGVKPEEATSDLYRFGLDVPADGKAMRFQVREVQNIQQTLSLVDLDASVFGFYLGQKVISPAVRDALSKASAMQAAIAALDQESQQLEARYAAIERDQARIRENMNTVSRQSDTYTKWERKLAEQEEAIYSIQSRREQVASERLVKQKERDGFLSNLNVE